MDERKRFRAFVGILAAVIVVGAIFGIGSVVVDGDSWAIVASIVILVATALVAIVVTRKKLKDLKSGFPSEDERSAAMKMRIGYLAFWVSVYLCFALGWIISLFVEDTSTGFIPLAEMMFVLAGLMCIIFIVIWAVASRGKGVQ
ncbi:MAG: hypothetical protein OEM29_00185 [Thermoplasmata archaeon]|nr:hypothetical protein [Thermoplasmata archaeon]